MGGMKKLLLATFVALLLAGCGGGGNERDLKWVGTWQWEGRLKEVTHRIHSETEPGTHIEFSRTDKHSSKRTIELKQDGTFLLAFQGSNLRNTSGTWISGEIDPSDYKQYGSSFLSPSFEGVVLFFGEEEKILENGKFGREAWFLRSLSDDELELKDWHNPFISNKENLFRFKKVD
tara:strand:- start:3648 stop:4175 length:528 start_codon:yes stop_codon:yes gene_type:complete